MKLFLVRHGQTAWNSESRAQGHSNIPLDEVGKQQAGYLAEALIGHDVKRIITSDLDRAYSTALPVANMLGLDAVKEPRLRERSLGEWEGITFAELFQHKAHITKSQGTPFESIVPPNGESIEMVWDRVAGVVADLRSQSSNALVVTHGGTGSLLMAQLLQGTMATARAFRFANAGITELQLRPDGAFLIVRFNDTTHLREAPLTGGIDGSHGRER